MESQTNNRRPLKSRDTRWAAALARLLARAGLRPNAISVISIVFAIAAGVCFILSRDAGTVAKALLLFGAAASIQLRLLCNLLDGMVAIEGGFKTKVGEIYNEFPDRFADIAILIGAGYASAWCNVSAELGWAAALLAVITAYNRALGVATGASQQFCGPMAKPHRMATITVACILAIAESLLHWPSRIIPIALCVIIVGCLVTIARRTSRIFKELNSK